jgi:hypothetical protein
VFYTQAHVRALEAQIKWLQEQLARSQQEERNLLDRLLIRANVTPMSEPLQSTKEPIQVMTPFGVLPGEMEDLVKDSWIRDEMEHWMNQGYDEARARQVANDEYLRQHKVIT